MYLIRKFQRLFLLCVAVIFASVFSQGVSAGEAKIVCTDIEDTDTCSLQANTSPKFIEIIGDVLSSVDQSTGVCKQSSLNSFDCTLPSNKGVGSTSIRCTRNANSASCVFLAKNNEPLDSDYFSLNCSVTGKRGECLLKTDEKGIKDDLSKKTKLTDNQLDVGANLLAGCSLQAGVIGDGDSATLTSYQRDCNAVIGLIQAGDYTAAANVVAEVTPRNADLASDTTGYNLSVQQNAVSNRMARLRSGETSGFDTAGLSLFDGTQWVSAGMMLADANTSMSDASPTAFPEGRLGVFLDGSIVSGSQDADAQGIEGDMDQSGNTFTLGIDYRITNQWIGGVAYSLSLNDLDFGGDSTVVNTGYNMLAYTTYYMNNIYVESTFGFGSDRYEQNRRLICGTKCGYSFNVSADSNYYSEQRSFTLGVGYDLSLGALIVTPNAQLSRVTLDTDSYRETTSNTNAAGAGYLLDMGAQSRQTRTLSAGVGAQYAISTSYGVILPQASVDMRRELNDDIMVIDGQFVGDVASGKSFLLETKPVDTSYAVVGGGASFQFTGGSSAFADVKTLVGYEDLKQMTIAAGWRWEI